MELTDTVETVLRTKGHQVWCVNPEERVYDAIKMMAEKGVGALLVVSEDGLLGIFSERDYLRKVELHGKSSSKLRVREIMNSPAMSMHPEDTVEHCMRIMTNSHIRHLPVLEHGAVVGILSIGDLVKWIISVQQQTIEQLHKYIYGNYPG